MGSAPDSARSRRKAADAGELDALAKRTNGRPGGGLHGDGRKVVSGLDEDKINSVRVSGVVRRWPTGGAYPPEGCHPHSRLPKRCTKLSSNKVPDKVHCRNKKAREDKRYACAQDIWRLKKVR